MKWLKEVIRQRIFKLRMRHMRLSAKQFILPDQYFKDTVEYNWIEVRKANIELQVAILELLIGE